MFFGNCRRGPSETTNNHVKKIQHFIKMKTSTDEKKLIHELVADRQVNKKKRASTLKRTELFELSK